MAWPLSDTTQVCRYCGHTQEMTEFSRVRQGAKNRHGQVHRECNRCYQGRKRSVSRSAQIRALETGTIDAADPQGPADGSAGFLDLDLTLALPVPIEPPPPLNIESAGWFYWEVRKYSRSRVRREEYLATLSCASGADRVASNSSTHPSSSRTSEKRRKITQYGCQDTVNVTVDTASGTCYVVAFHVDGVLKVRAIAFNTPFWRHAAAVKEPTSTATRSYLIWKVTYGHPRPCTSARCMKRIHFVSSEDYCTCGLTYGTTHWRKIKQDYSNALNRPRLDHLVYIVSEKVCLDMSINLTQFLKGLEFPF
ncbi:hypothetical protein R1sor_000032 [Riccia sorocarpa]|uniref:Uncharacterized protein n=1 Tax=Riccia sorocarpa TaxID=122646 RepID=A0ABD3GV50_9MARC